MQNATCCPPQKWPVAGMVMRQHYRQQTGWQIAAAFPYLSYVMNIQMRLQPMDAALLKSWSGKAGKGPGGVILMVYQTG